MSVLSYLEKRATSAILSATEEAVIQRSMLTLADRIQNALSPSISDQFRFGSSTRGTILPRKWDEHSDIDVMIVFSDEGYAPQTYLDRLRRFSEMHYPRSNIKQSFPSVILELNHIKFDLVPALNAFWTDYKIPDRNGSWQGTNPKSFNTELTTKNNDHDSLVKPAIRLTKLWNAANGYVYESYLLEQAIVTLGFTFCKNLKDYLFRILANLPDADAAWKRERIARAQQIAARVRDYERNGLPQLGETEIRKLIPE